MTDNITNLARNLRDNSTNAERYLWRHIKAKQLDGHKFRRQQPVDNYIVDFVCLETRLIIELDGGHHSEKEVARYDDHRERALKKSGFTILRFWNNDVLRNMEGVLETIREALQTPLTLPSPARGEGKGKS